MRKVGGPWQPAAKQLLDSPGPLTTRNATSPRRKEAGTAYALVVLLQGFDDRKELVYLVLLAAKLWVFIHSSNRRGRRKQHEALLSGR